MNGFQASECSSMREVYVEILGAFAELRKLTLSVVVSVSLSFHPCGADWITLDGFS
jgi:hypothetical protein